MVDKSGKDFGSKLEQLNAVAKMTGKKPAELNYPPIVDDFQYLLEHFYTVKTAKGERLTYTELESYSRMLAIDLSAFEVDIIMQIDRIFEAET